MSEASSNSSLRSADRFNLDEHDKSDILVYEYRKGLKCSSQEELCRKLDKENTPESRLRCSKIPIPRGNSRIEVHQGDLFPEDQRHMIEKKPNFRSSVASIMLPFSVRMKRMLFDQYKDLYIVSPEGSPESSPTNSKHTSPSQSWPANKDGTPDSAPPPTS